MEDFLQHQLPFPTVLQELTVEYLDRLSVELILPDWVSYERMYIPRIVSSFSERTKHCEIARWNWKNDLKMTLRRIPIRSDPTCHYRCRCVHQNQVTSKDHEILKEIDKEMKRCVRT